MKTTLDWRTRREDILRIASQYGGRNVRVFGSHARRQATAESDLDILLELEPGRTLLDLIAIKQDLEDVLGCKVDVVTEASVSPYLREPVLKEAVSV